MSVKGCAVFKSEELNKCSHIKMIHCPSHSVTNLENRKGAQNENLYDVAEGVL